MSLESVGFFDPPAADRELNSDIVREVVRNQFPQLPVQSIAYLGSGWEQDAYLVDDHVVFRFPRYADVGRGFAREERLLSLVARAAGASAGIPRITFWGEPSARFPHPFAGHELIPGVGADHPDVPWAAELADDLAGALTRIHAIPPALAKAVDVVAVATNCRDPLAELQRQVDLIPEFRDAAPDPCAWLDAGPAVPSEYDGPARFIHDDFSADHIIVDPATGRLSGIIDWSDAALGDPAQDFSYLLLARGWSFLQRTLAAYALPVDVAFTERTVFLARVRALGWLADAIRRRAPAAPVLDAVRRTFHTR